MAYFPFMVDVKDMNCLVVGGGRVALRKIRTLLQFELTIHIVAENISKELNKVLEEYKVKNALDGMNMISIVERSFREADLDGMQMVIVATDDKALNKKIAKQCKERKIPVNVIDQKELSSFTFPALIQQEDVLVAISSSGQSPASVSYLKNKINEAIPSYYGDMVKSLGRYRRFILDSVEEENLRKEIFYQLLEHGEQNAGRISEEEVQGVVERVKRRKISL